MAYTEAFGRNLTTAMMLFYTFDRLSSWLETVERQDGTCQMSAWRRDEQWGFFFDQVVYYDTPIPCQSSFENQICPTRETWVMEMKVKWCWTLLSCD